MERKLSEEDVALQSELRAFFENEVPDHLKNSYMKDGEAVPEILRESQKFLDEHNLAAPQWPEEWGGRGWDELQLHIYRSELQRAGLPSPLPFNINMVGPVIAAFGSQELKERFLPKTKSLEIWWSQGFSEPDSGSDLASLRTTAVREGDEWVVNGQKTWTTLGQYGDWIFTLVRTDPKADKPQKGISFLLIDMKSEGLTVRPIKLIDGGVEVNEVFFDNVRVPADQLVGQENKGWDYAKFLLGNERTSAAPVGSIKAVLAQAKQHARETRSPNGTALDDPLLAARFAELEAEVMALELTVLRVAGDSRDGRPDPASSILKLRGSELQQEVFELMVDVAGVEALTWHTGDWGGETLPRYLNFRKASIYSGSNEVQRNIISGGILGLRG